VPPRTSGPARRARGLAAASALLYTVLVVVALATTTGLSTLVSTGTAFLGALCTALVAAAAVLLAMPAPPVRRD
jgi:hypothetical protein